MRRLTWPRLYKSVIFKLYIQKISWFVFVSYSNFKKVHCFICSKPFTSVHGDIQPLLNPHWITGFTDAEGCFCVKCYPSAGYRLKWRVQPVFQIKLHERNTILLNHIKQYFAVGTLVKNGKYTVYTVKSIKNLSDIIIPHFNTYVLLSKKLADFSLFKTNSLHSR